MLDHVDYAVKMHGHSFHLLQYPILLSFTWRSFILAFIILSTCLQLLARYLAFLEATLTHCFGDLDSVFV